MTIGCSNSWSEKGSVEECLKDFEGWHPDIVDLVKNVDTLNKWGLFVRPSLATWSKGRVTLLGDACHSMLPYLGQGVNMALEDASVLARCFDENPNDVAAAFETYQGLRLDRTSKVVKSAAGMLPIFHNQALCKPETAGDYIKTQWAPEATAARYDWIYQYDATTVPLHYMLTIVTYWSAAVTAIKQPWDDVMPLEERETYALAGLGGAAGFGKRPALLVIDVQYRSVGDRPMPIREAIKQYPTSCGEAGWHAIAHIAELVRLFREKELAGDLPACRAEGRPGPGRVLREDPGYHADPARGL